MNGFRRAAHVIAVLIGLLTSAAHGRELSIDERIQVQTSIDRVYFSHQFERRESIGRAVPDTVLSNKVRSFLQKVQALEQTWGEVLTPEMLRAETKRIATSTHMPERLAELYAAVGHDPFLFEECVVRPLLTDRRVRRRYSTDRAIHARARHQAESLREDLRLGRIDPREDAPFRRTIELRTIDGPGRSASREIVEVESEEFFRIRGTFPERIGEVGDLEEDESGFHIRVVLEQGSSSVKLATFTVTKRPWESWWRAARARFNPDASTAISEPEGLPEPRAVPCLVDDTWTMDGLPEGRYRNSAVWTGAHFIVWGGNSQRDLRSGSRYDPVLDDWSPVTKVGAPTVRRDHTAVWTGSEMIVWGGIGNDTYRADGAAYDPVADAWRAISASGAPSARSWHTAVWTGTEMLIWGGSGEKNTGARYEPNGDSWSPITTVGAPTGRYGHTAVWIGTRMIVWGGTGPPGVEMGGRYDPASDTWTPVSTIGAPPVAYWHSGVSTGNRMIVWGGAGVNPSGGIYDPVADSWVLTSTNGAPATRQFHTAVWTGDRMIVWGGITASQELNDGRSLDPVDNIWTPLSLVGAPAARSWHSAAWTGSEMIVWGGSGNKNTGSRYDPLADRWTPTSTEGAPAARFDHIAVWTGSQVLVWGGNFPPTGGRYDPALDAWTPMSLLNAPLAHDRMAGAWTGEEYFVWGGFNNGTLIAEGGRYEPISDTWRTPTTEGAPVLRYSPGIAAVGAKVVVWGGYSTTGERSGGVYDPTTDSWSPISTAGAPVARWYNTMIAVGQRVAVWGGNDSSTTFQDGGLYDPASDTWSPITTVGAPTKRNKHTAVWTGSEMIVWGGAGAYSWIGGRYDPNADSWTLMTETDAPASRESHTAVWTGSEMVVWGGKTGVTLAATETGARYDPALDRWLPTSLAAPTPRSAHTAVWTGSAMHVWGGVAGFFLNTGGWYSLGHDDDGDGDGATECAGDCNDDRAAVGPGAAEACDGLDNDCNGVADEGFDAPGPVGGLVFLTSSELVWLGRSDADAYDVVTGRLEDLAQTEGDFSESVMGCAAESSTNPTHLVAASPLPGSGWWYLVRAQTDCKAGSYSAGGTGEVPGRDAEIASATWSCGPP